MKNILIAVISMLALSLSACGSTDSSAGELSQPESTTTAATTTASAPDSAGEDTSAEYAMTVDFEGEPKEDFSEMTSENGDDSAGEITVDTTSTNENSVAGTDEDSKPETAETTAEKATTTSKAVTSSATTAKKATTTTKTVAQTTTTTKKAATTTTTAKQATTTTTTTTKKQEQPAQQASSVEWTPLLLAYRHYLEATLNVMDDMDLYDSSKITDAEIEMIRKDICDYGLNNFNGKQVVTVYTPYGEKTLDFLRPLELTVDTSLTCYLQGSIVLGDAHLNAGAAPYTSKWYSSDAYYKLTEKEKYDLSVESRQNCLRSFQYCLYQWYDYLAGNNEEKYAYIMTYNFGFLANGADFWFLTK